MATTRYDGSVSLTCAETAKLVRAALKREFPGTKFSVRSDVYAGGASIRVQWTDGPTSGAVETVARAFAGADFDGMVDLKTYRQHWLEPDGTVRIAYAGAGGSTLPEVVGDPPSPRAQLVRFGADFVFCERDHSPEWRALIEAEIAAYAGSDVFDANTSYPVSCFKNRERGGAGLARDRHRGEYGSTLVYQLAEQRDRSGPCAHSFEVYGIGGPVFGRCEGCGELRPLKRDA